MGSKLIPDFVTPRLVKTTPPYLGTFCYMTNEGWIKLYRKFIESALWHFAIQAKLHYLIPLWIHCLLSANWEKKNWYDGKEEIEIDEGTFITSIGNLSESLSLTPQQIRTGLQHIEKMKMITRQTTNRWTLIKIVNWGKYQLQETLNNKPDNKRITNEQQTDNKRITTTKEYKNINTGTASPVNKSFKKPSFPSNRHLGFQTIGQMATGDTRITTQAQEEALRIAEQLNIDLDMASNDDPSLRGRWFKFFKDAYLRKQASQIQLTYSYLYDLQVFKTIPSSQKIKLFFWRFANPNKFLEA